MRLNDKKQRALIAKWRKAANEALTADEAVTYNDCADDLESAIAVKFLIAICEGCRRKVQMPTQHATRRYPDLPTGWSQSGVSRYGIAGRGVRLAAWCPNCRAKKSTSEALSAVGLI